MPLACLSLFLLVLAAKVFYKRCVKGQTQHLTSSLPSFISTVVAMMYLLYLLLVRNSLDLFSCVPAVPEDPRGTLYMEATVTPCYEGMHLMLFPWGIVTLLVYGTSAPLSLP